MNIRRFLLQPLLVCAEAALIPRLFTRPATAKPVINSIPYEAIDAYVEEQMRRLNIPGLSLAIDEGDKIVHLRGFGQACPDGEAPTPQTPFFIGSLTKSITALAIMQLVEAGKIELDAPAQRYLPWFRVADLQASAQITVRHLLNQTSGLSESSGRLPLADFDNSPGATERQARALASIKLNRSVGSAFEYSNSNYNLLGLIIEAASGESYEAYIQNHIFGPLEMSHSYTSKAAATQNGLAMGHQYWFAIPFAAPNMPTPHGSLPSGQLISSSEDMARYLIPFLNGGRYGEVQILSKAGIDELHRGVAEYTQLGMSFGKYGMGWLVDEIGATEIVWHSGMAPDFFSYMAILPEQKKGLVLLFNAYHYWMTPALTEVGAGVAALLAGDQPAPNQFGFMHWALRGLMLVPAAQIVGLVATLRLLNLWRQDPQRRPSGGRMRGRHILLPLVPNLLLALTLIPMLGKLRGFRTLFMPDFSWIARVCGSFALVWSFLRTGLILRTLRKASSPQSSVGRLDAEQQVVFRTS